MQPYIQGFMDGFTVHELQRGERVYPGLDATIMAGFYDVAVDRLKVSPADIRPEADFFETLGLDSIDLMSAVMAVEERLGIEVPDVALEHITTIAEMLVVLRGLTIEQNPDIQYDFKDPGDDEEGGSGVREPVVPSPVGPSDFIAAKPPTES